MVYDWYKVEFYFLIFLIANPNQTTIFLDQVYEEIEEICNKSHDHSGLRYISKTLLLEIARIWEKEN